MEYHFRGHSHNFAYNTYRKKKKNILNFYLFIFSFQTSGSIPFPEDDHYHCH